MSASPIGIVVEVAEPGRHLMKERGFLVVREGSSEVGRIPLDDIAAVLATSPATTVSAALLAELAGRGLPFAVCGGNFVPAGVLWPLRGHHAQQRRMETQLAATRPLGKRLWALLVAGKLRRQGWALRQIGAADGAFDRMARNIKSGDTENLEAQGARRYWPLLLGSEFRRNTDGDGPNALLNYGYAVLRAAVARAIVAAGLHPGLGVFHRHPQNAMPLADDLMEPFRPFVDIAARSLWVGGVLEVTPEAKRELAGVLWHQAPTAIGMSPLSTCIHRLAASVADSFMTGEPHIDLPLVQPSCAQDVAEDE